MELVHFTVSHGNGNGIVSTHLLHLTQDDGNAEEEEGGREYVEGGRGDMEGERERGRKGGRE